MCSSIENSYFASLEFFSSTFLAENQFNLKDFSSKRSTFLEICHMTWVCEARVPVYSDNKNVTDRILVGRELYSEHKWCWRTKYGQCKLFGEPMWSSVSQIFPLQLKWLSGQYWGIKSNLMPIDSTFFSYFGNVFMTDWWTGRGCPLKWTGMVPAYYLQSFFFIYFLPALPPS